MTEATAVHPVGTRRVVVLVGLLVVGLGAVVWTASSYVHRRGSSPWKGPVFALTTTSLVVAVMALTRARRDRPTWVAAFGLMLVALGSGIGRPRERVHRTTRSDTHLTGYDVVDRLDSRGALVVFGLLLIVGAAIWTWRAAGARIRVLPTASLLAVGIGYAVVAVAMRDIVVGYWMSGRPLRRGRRGARRNCGAVEHRDPADLWRDAAADEAEAVAAFSVLAERLAAVGAPAPLVGRCQEAAREERGHTASCLHLASRLGTCRGAAPIGATPRCQPTEAERGSTRTGRTLEVLRLAVESFVDGVVGEGFAARRLEAGSTTVAGGHGPRLRSMALEERRHAALGADIVGWALQQHPGLVAGALRRAARRLPEHTEVPAAHRGFTPTELRRVGMTDAQRADELWEKERAEALRWLDDTLGAREPLSRSANP